MDKQTILKTSAFGGFEKKAVLDYIYKLNEDAEYAQAQLQEQLNEATRINQENEAKIKELTALSERQGQDLDAAKHELEGERARMRQLTALTEGQEEDLARHRELLDAKQREAEKYTRDNLKLIEANSKLESKKEEVERAYAQIGKLMLDARRDADMAVARANEEAQAITDKADEEANGILDEAKSGAEALRQSAEEEINAAMHAAGIKSEALLNEARASLDLVAGRFEDFRHKIADAQIAVTQTLEAMLEKTAGACSDVNMAIDIAGRKLEAAYEPVVELAVSGEPAHGSGHAEDSVDKEPEPDGLITESVENRNEGFSMAGEGPPEHCFFR